MSPKAAPRASEPGQPAPRLVRNPNRVRQGGEGRFSDTRSRKALLGCRQRTGDAAPERALTFSPGSSVRRPSSRSVFCQPLPETRGCSGPRRGVCRLSSQRCEAQACGAASGTAAPTHWKRPRSCDSDSTTSRWERWCSAVCCPVIYVNSEEHASATMSRPSAICFNQVRAPGWLRTTCRQGPRTGWALCSAAGALAPQVPLVSRILPRALVTPEKAMC